MAEIGDLRARDAIAARMIEPRLAMADALCDADGPRFTAARGDTAKLGEAPLAEMLARAAAHVDL